MQATSKIESIIREETGLGPLTMKQGQYLQVLIRAAFRTKGSVLVMYMTNRKLTIYLMPTNNANEVRPVHSEPIEKEEYDTWKPTAQQWLDKLLTKTKDFSGLTLFYKFKIVRVIPESVKRGEKITWQSNH